MSCFQKSNKKLLHYGRSKLADASPSRSISIARPLARGQKVWRHTSGWSRRSPDLFVCVSKGIVRPEHQLVELLNSLLGALRAFRSPIPLNVPGPLPSRRTAGERSFPSIPSFPWSAEDKLIPVVLERCNVPFTSAKVVLFLGLFSPLHFHRFLNLFGMCELHLRTFAVAGDHLRNFFFLGVSSAFRQQVQRLGPRPIDCTVNSYEN